MSASAPRATVATSEDQASMTPASVVADLVAGNRRYVDGQLTPQDQVAQRPLAAQGQHPKAIVLSCVDSRVPVETIFDCGIGDVFVARVAGNTVNADILGSMEFACHLAGSKVILVLGHQSCGAIRGAVDGVELGNLTELLSKFAPAIDSAETTGERSSTNPDFLAAVTEANVANAIDRIRAESPVLATMEADGEIAIVGAIYSLSTGTVTLLD